MSLKLTSLQCVYPLAISLSLSFALLFCPPAFYLPTCFVHYFACPVIIICARGGCHLNKAMENARYLELELLFPHPPPPPSPNFPPSIKCHFRKMRVCHTSMCVRSQLLLLFAVVLFLFSFCLAGLFVCLAACPRWLVESATEQRRPPPTAQRPLPPIRHTISQPHFPPPPVATMSGVCQHCILQGASRNDYTAFNGTRGSLVNGPRSASTTRYHLYNQTIPGF